MFVEIYSALSVATESAAIATGKLISHILGRSSRAPRRSYLLLGLGAPRSRAPLAIPLSCYFLVSLFYPATSLDLLSAVSLSCYSSISLLLYLAPRSKISLYLSATISPLSSPKRQLWDAKKYCDFFIAKSIITNLFKAISTVWNQSDSVTQSLQRFKLQWLKSSLWLPKWSHFLLNLNWWIRFMWSKSLLATAST